MKIVLLLHDSFTIARGEGTSTERDHHTILSLGEIVVGDKRFAELPYCRYVV